MMPAKRHKPLASPAAGELPSPAPGFPWSPRVRAVASVLIALHVAAVFVAPWSMPPPASQLSGTAARYLRPYMLATAQYNGYRFFAPNPGPSHLVRYELELENGEIRRGQFPDVQEHWPRLLYHRHFMIAERVNELSTPPAEPPALPADLPPRWRRRAEEFHQALRTQYEAEASRRAGLREMLVRPIAAELLRRHNAKRIRLWSVEHAIPTPQQVLDGMPPDDESLYRLRPWRLLGEYAREDFPAASARQPAAEGPQSSP